MGIYLEFHVSYDVSQISSKKAAKIREYCGVESRVTQ